MSNELTIRQEQAARLHAGGLSKAEACRRAGYAKTTAKKAQSRIFGKEPVIAAVTRFRQELIRQLEQQGMTPEAIARGLAGQLAVDPLGTIALWVRIVAPNDRAQLQQEVVESGKMLVGIVAEELARLKLTTEQQNEFYWNVTRRIEQQR